MKIAAAAYPADWHQNWRSYEEKITRWVAATDADLLVFPEYGAMELASLAGALIAKDLKASIQAVSDLSARTDALHAALACERGKHILAASGPVLADGLARNRARLFTPSGGCGAQDKIVMTRFEREEWAISGGGPLRVFETAVGRIGVLICYDAEFPLLSRALVEAGAEILLVPSCTDSAAGYRRVRIGAMARALEGQCVVVHAALVGAADWSPAIDVSIGAAAIYGPPDKGFPDSGVVAEGAMNAPGWVEAEIDLSRVADVRTDGAVLNVAHWVDQDRVLSPPFVQTERL